MRMTQPLIRLRAEAMQMRGGKNILRGELFSAPADEVESLVALHFATVVDEPPVVAVVQPYATKHETAAPPTVTHQRHGRYSRRDLRSGN